MEFTPNYNLKKPAAEDFYNVNDYNENADIIDAELSNKVNKSEYTANDVLDKLKTVDGSGSGLDADTVDGKHASDIQNDAQSKVDTHANVTASLSTLGHVKHAVLTATLDTTWSGTSAPYTKTVSVSGILSTDTPIIDVVMSGTYATDEARAEAWGYIYRTVTANDSITFYAMEKPTVSLPIQIRVVR